MIVNKPISAVKVGNTRSRLTVGKKVPQEVIDFWKKNKQFEELKNGGFISDEKEESKQPQNNQNKTEENKIENKSMSEKK